MNRGQVIYEVTLQPDPSIETEFDAWLDDHIRDMLGLPGFVGATVYRGEDPASEAPLRTVHYELRDRAALEMYLREHAERMRAHGIERFGERFRASRRILDSRREITSSVPSGAACANCEAPLYGQYCAICGQRARERMISLWEMIREASEILTSLDSRLWRTLGMLLFRPGRLTRDYLLGRRARYIPALRLFLGLSLLFFFLFSLDNRFVIDTGDENGSDGDISIQLHMGDDEAGPTVAKSLPANGTAGEADVPRTESMEAPGTPSDVVEGSQSETPSDTESGAGQEIDSCADINVDWPDGMEWADRWLSTERVRGACDKIVADHGESFARALLENIPAMMFVFVPLMALVMKVLYPLTGRFYAEHLLFLVHYHAFFYLLLSVAILLGWIFARLPAIDWMADVFFAVSAIYIPVYLFRAMRVVYGQGRMITAIKYVLLGVAYFTSLVLFLVGTVTITAVTL